MTDRKATLIILGASLSMAWVALVYLIRLHLPTITRQHRLACAAGFFVGVGLVECVALFALLARGVA
jgi:F0F1-type ATP synthase membrane subunit c/vacuolar-type H+-ATPase subunit K